MIKNQICKSILLVFLLSIIFLNIKNTSFNFCKRIWKFCKISKLRRKNFFLFQFYFVKLRVFENFFQFPFMLIFKNFQKFLIL